MVDVYGGRLGSNHRHTFGGRLIFNGQLLANHGYAVLWPDMPMTGPDPLRQLPGLITPAVDELVAAGVVDRKRVGVMGQSYGGYCALGLLTQTSLFRAGVCTAGSVDLVSAYGTLTPRGDSQWIGWLESGDGRLGGSLWDRPEAYVENSPLFHLHHIAAPILLACGTANQEEVGQAGEAFSALRRLGKTAELRLYDGEEHDPGEWTERNQHDLIERIIRWFDTHL